MYLPSISISLSSILTMYVCIYLLPFISLSVSLSICLYLLCLSGFKNPLPCFLYPWHCSHSLAALEPMELLLPQHCLSRLSISSFHGVSALFCFLGISVLEADVFLLEWFLCSPSFLLLFSHIFYFLQSLGWLTQVILLESTACF